MENKNLLRGAEVFYLWQTAIFVMLLMSLGVSQKVKAQVPNEFSTRASQDGFILSQSQSNSSVGTGQTFSYTIYFSIPAGATNITVSDVLPSSLQYVSSEFSVPDVKPIVVVPSLDSMGGTYSISVAAAPEEGFSGSFSIIARFSNGTTCNGISARNRICVQAKMSNKNINFCTEYLAVAAVAVNPWHISRSPIGVSNTQGSCPFISLDSVVTYQLEVYKDVGTTGQMNLVKGVVQDSLPVGAVLQSSTCGATQSGNIVTWNVGNQSAVGMFNSQKCTLKIVYPGSLFPRGTNLMGHARLTGALGGLNPSCGNVNLLSNQTCVQLQAYANAPPLISKFVTTTRLPGSTVQYEIKICNPGSTNLTSFRVEDIIPASLTGVTIGSVAAGLTASIDPNNDHKVIITNTSALTPPNCRSVFINCTIPVTSANGTVFNNCAVISSLTTPAQFPQTESCAPFTVIAPTASPLCLFKEVCNQQIVYKPGAIVRYRLRIQNIGGSTVTGATLTDVLNLNLEYMGNLSSYANASPSVSCQSASTWSITIIPPTANTLTINLPTIAAGDPSITCGQAGNSALQLFYFIEFDVKIRDTSALGNIPNTFSVTTSGGVTISSNIAHLTVNALANFFLVKQVRITPTATDPNTIYANTASPSPGGYVDYKLQMRIPFGMAPLRYVTFVEELPRNINSTSAPFDRKILVANNGNPVMRTSATSASVIPHVTYESFYNATSIYNSSPLFTSFKNTLTNANPNGIGVTDLTYLGLFNSMFSNGAGSNTTWVTTPPISPPDKNLAYYFGSLAFPADPVSNNNNNTQTVLSVELKAKVSSQAQAGQTACNTFAASAWVKKLLTGSNGVLTTTFERVVGFSERESGLACITIPNEPQDNCGILQVVETDASCCRLNGTISNSMGKITKIQYAVQNSGGVVQNFTTSPCIASSTNPLNLAGTQNGTLNFSNCNSPLNFSIEAVSSTASGLVTIEVIVTVDPPSGPDILCREIIEIQCPPAPQIRCDEMVVIPYTTSDPQTANERYWRTFKVTSSKIPDSPIKQIKISFSPDPFSASPTTKWAGKHLTVNPAGGIGTNAWNASNSWLNPNIIQYSLIDLRCNENDDNALLNNFNPITGFVQFRLGVKSSLNWAGTVTITTIHCDGGICINTNEWCARPNPLNCPQPMLPNGSNMVEDPIKTKLLASRILVKGDAKIKISYAIIEPDVKDGARILALGVNEFGINEQGVKSMKLITNSSIFSEENDNSRYAGIIEFGDGLRPNDTAEVPVVVELPAKSDVKSVKLRITLYDEGANIIYVDSTIATALTSIRDGDEEEAVSGRPFGSNAELHPAEPTPTDGTVQFSYWLSSLQTVKLELYDALGKNIAQIETGNREPGKHTFRYDAKGLPSGSYILLLTTPYGVYSQPVIVQH